MVSRFPHRLRYSLASLAGVLTVLAIGLGFWANRAHRQREAVRVLKSSGATIRYSDHTNIQFDDERDEYRYDRPSSVPVHLGDDSWFRDFLFDAVAVEARYQQAFSDLEMNAIADLPKIRSVEVPGTNVTSRGVVNLRYCPELLRLDLSETAADDSCLGYLGELRQLRELRLAKTKISDQGLVKLWLSTGLRTLDVNAPQVSEAGAEQIQRRLRDCNVVFARRKTVPSPPRPRPPGGGFAGQDAIGTGIEPVSDRALTTDELNYFFEQARILIRKPVLSDFLFDEEGNRRTPGDLRNELEMYNVDRRLAAERLQMLRHRCVIPVLAAILRDETDDPKVRAETASSLARVPEPLVVEILIEALPDGDGVGRAAEYSLVGMTMVGVGRQKGERFNEQPPEARLKRQAEWRAWWDKNRDRVRLKPPIGSTDYFFTEAEWEAQLPKEQREIPSANEAADSLPESDDSRPAP